MGIVAPPIIFFTGRSKAAQVLALQGEGVRLEAQIIEIKHLPRGADGLRYAFTVGGRSFVKTESASPKTVERLSDKASLSVVYLPSDPNIVTYDLEGLSESATVSTTWGPWVIAGSGLVCGSAGLARLREA